MLKYNLSVFIKAVFIITLFSSHLFSQDQGVVQENQTSQKSCKSPKRQIGLIHKNNIRSGWISFFLMQQRIQNLKIFIWPKLQI